MAEDSDNNVLRVEENSGKREIRVRRDHAQANYRIPKRKYKVGGKTVMRKETTTNDEKIADTCIELFQNSEIAQQFDYSTLHERALEALEPRFSKYGIVIQDGNTKTRNKEIEHLRQIAIDQWIREHIADEAGLIFEFDYDEFIEATGIVEAKRRVGRALEILSGAQSKSAYEWSQEIVNEDFSEINHEIVRVSVIPTISLVLDDEMGKKYKTIEDFAKAPIKNKKRHIKKIKLEINRTFLPNILGIGRDYTKAFRRDRLQFTSSAAYRLDILARSIEKVQHIQKFRRFTFESLKDKFGSDIAEYRFFKRLVLTPAVRDVNKYTELEVSFKEFRKNNTKAGPIEFIELIVKRKKSLENEKRFDTTPLAYYIASRMYFFGKEGIENLIGFAKHVEKTIDESNDEQDLVFAGRTVREWQIEADLAYQAENEIQGLIDKHPRFMKSNNLTYDNKKMCILKTSSEDQLFASEEYIVMADKKVTNPIQSLDYLNGIVENDMIEKAHVHDFIPFKFITIGGEWIDINSLSVYSTHKDLILKAIVNRKDDYFRFETNDKRDLFLSIMHREGFVEVTEEFRRMLKSLTK